MSPFSFLPLQFLNKMHQRNQYFSLKFLIIMSFISASTFAAILFHAMPNPDCHGQSSRRYLVGLTEKDDRNNYKNWGGFLNVIEILWGPKLWSKATFWWNFQKHPDQWNNFSWWPLGRSGRSTKLDADQHQIAKAKVILRTKRNREDDWIFEIAIVPSKTKFIRSKEIS